MSHVTRFSEGDGCQVSLCALCLLECTCVCWFVCLMSIVSCSVCVGGGFGSLPFICDSVDAEFN